VNLVTRTLTARIELANPQQRLKPGMFVTVSFAPAHFAEVFLVPTEAIIQTGQRAVVIVSKDGKFTPVDVELGLEAAGQTEIRAGLTLDQEIVVSGQFLLDSEASLQGTATRMSEPMKNDRQDANR
jgi:membrane fusion protein, copper/silver efflux system